MNELLTTLGHLETAKPWLLSNGLILLSLIWDAVGGDLAKVKELLTQEINASPLAPEVKAALVEDQILTAIANGLIFLSKKGAALVAARM